MQNGLIPFQRSAVDDVQRSEVELGRRTGDYCGTGFNSFSEMFLFVGLLLLISVTGGDLQSVKKSDIKYVCPEDFHLVGKKCYHFSPNEVTWHDSRFYCATLNSSLALVDSHRELNLLRNYLNQRVTELGNYERWIDAIYDWKELKWKWGASGQQITFNKFARMQIGEKFTWNCIVLDPNKKNRWRARKCTDKKHYVCETDTNAFIEFKLYDKKINKKFNIVKCSKPELLSKYERRTCLKLLGSVENNEPGYLVKHPKPTKTTNDIDRFVCPRQMVNLGNRCYTFSRNAATFEDAFYDCRNNKSKLAIIRSRAQDYSLRIFLNNFIEKHDRWIGGVYDPKTGQWKWALTGQPLKYKAFAKEAVKNRSKESYNWNAIFMDPSLDNRWNAALQTEKKHYVCQVKAKAVKTLGAKLKPPKATIRIVTKT